MEGEINGHRNLKRLSSSVGTSRCMLIGNMGAGMIHGICEAIMPVIYVGHKIHLTPYRHLELTP